MFVKILLCTAAVVAAMAAVKDGRILAEAGLVGSCIPVELPAGQTGAWHACTPGRLTGPPDLARHNCTAQGRRGADEVWRCPVALASGPR